MKTYRIYILIALLVLFSQNSYSQESITVLAGQSRTISVPPNSQINIGDPSIATARALSRRGQLIITGRSKGVTSLAIYLPGGKVEERLIRVIERDPHTVLREIKEIYGVIEGVKFSIKGEELVAEGAVYTESDQEALDKILQRYAQIINMVENKSEKPMINIKIQFIEVNRSKGTDFNNRPLPQGIGSFSKSDGSPFRWSISGQASDLFERIAYWRSSGAAKLIANPTLTVTNGDTATFLAGGEIPITAVFRDQVTITYKEYGVRMKVVPTLTGNGKIHTHVTAEVSSVDFSTLNEVTGNPGFLSRRVTNNSTVREGETIALAGIYQKVVFKSKKRVPILGHILPFIFSSIKETEEVKELIVLITPRTPIDFNIDNYPMIKKELQTTDRY